MPQQVGHLSIPGQRGDVEQHGAAGVGVVGGVTPGQPVKEPGIDGAKGEMTSTGILPGTGNILQYPGRLTRREKGIHQ